jgi:hypothetical protein
VAVVFQVLEHSGQQHKTNTQRAWQYTNGSIYRLPRYGWNSTEITAACMPISSTTKNDSKAYHPNNKYITSTIELAFLLP